MRQRYSRVMYAAEHPPASSERPSFGLVWFGLILFSSVFVWVDIGWFGWEFGLVCVCVVWFVVVWFAVQRTPTYEFCNT